MAVTHHTIVQLRAGMKDQAVVGRRGAHTQAFNDIALARCIGIAVCGQHDTERGTSVPVDLDLVECAGNRVLKYFGEVALDARHDRLCLGVAHPAVELECLDVAIRIDHQPGIEKSGVSDALHGRHDDFAQHAGMHFGCDHRCRRISPHAAGIRAGIVVAQALVILA